MSVQRVALVEWHWQGHHPTYFAHFVLALEELGADVLALCPQPEEARETVARLRRQQGLGPARNGGTEYRQVVVHRRRFSLGPLSRLSEIDWTRRHFRSIEAQAGGGPGESGKRPDLIFYACIYGWEFQWFQWTRSFLRVPWAGLLLHAPSLRRPGQTGPVMEQAPCPEEKIFRGPLCRGAAILDEGMATRLGAITGKPVVVFPDLTDERLPAGPGEGTLGDRLRKFATGRPVVGLFGHLQKTKGVLPLMSASRNPRMSDICFAFGGDMEWSCFSANERALISDALTNGTNTWNHLLRIPDGEQMNSALAACDVLCAAYLDFPHSSNIMTKAALLRKPLIVSDGYLMAERVRRFKMGEVVPPGDVEALVAAIARLTSDPAGWAAENRPLWADYLREHSFARLKHAFAELLDKP